MENMKKPEKKALIILASILVLFVVGVCLTVFVFLPMYHYKQGDIAFANGNYEIAYNHFISSISYKDSEERAEISRKANHYSNGITALNEYRFEDARTSFALAEDYLDASTRFANIDNDEIYHNAEVAYEASDYETARANFELILEYNDSAERYIICTYEYGEYLMSSGSYHDAAKCFHEISDYEDSASRAEICADTLLELGEYDEAARTYSLIGNMSYFNYCKGLSYFFDGDYQGSLSYFGIAGGVADTEMYANIAIFKIAEQYFSEGRLNLAKNRYLGLPENYEYDGVSVQERLQTLEEYQYFVDLCGKWRSTDNRISSRETLSYYYHEWYREDVYGCDLEIKCIINEDSTVTIIGEAEYKIFTNYSVSSYLCDIADRVSYFTLTVARGSSVPRNIDGSGEASFTFSNGIFSLHRTISETAYYGYVDTYTADFTYDERSESYI